MKVKRNIIWLVSYPKSGNTWLRILLTNYLSDNDMPADINNLITSGIASNRNIFEEATGLNSADISLEEIEKLRPDVYRYYSGSFDENIYIKVHDANTCTGNNEKIFPPEITRAVIYLVRNPLDVAVSFKFHSNSSFDKTTRFICNQNASFCSGSKLFNLQLEQKLLSWNNHVKSWLNDNSYKILPVRYEDLLKNTGKEFEKIIDFLDLPVDNLIINRAVNYSNFETLKKTEKENGFSEKPVNADAFFRKGIENDWVNYLTEKQVLRIRQVNREMMERFGYISCL